jgi:hypothetical protein
MLRLGLKKNYAWRGGKKHFIGKAQSGVSATYG